ncbi:MAG: hypothetical protein ACRD4M_11360, partial [Candidatus Acidiferrales bacterium]
SNFTMQQRVLDVRLRGESPCKLLAATAPTEPIAATYRNDSAPMLEFMYHPWNIVVKIIFGKPVLPSDCLLYWKLQNARKRASTGPPKRFGITVDFVPRKRTMPFFEGFTEGSCPALCTCGPAAMLQAPPS